MQLSVFTVSTPEYDITEVVKVLKELGFDGIEWRVSDPAMDKSDDYSFETRYWYNNLSTIDVKKIDEVAAEIKNICDKSELKIFALSTGLEAWETEDIERVMKAANTMNCRNIRVIAPWYDGKESYVELFNKTVEQTKILEKLAEKYDVRICFETHMGNIIPSASAAYRLVSNFNPKYIGVIFDPGNMVFEGFENYRLGIELLGEYLSHIHLKNAVWELKETTGDGVNVWKQTWVPLNKGYADIKKLVKVLKDTGYEGFMSLEDFTNETDTYTKLKNCIDFLKSIT